jgi:hypothetical protein
MDEVYDLARREMARCLEEGEGRTLALRLILSGATAAHGELHRRSFQVTEELRGLAASLDGVWLEEVRFATRPHDNRPLSVAADTPLAGLLRTVEEVVDGEEILAVVPELALLRSKLPAEVLSDEELLAAPGENQGQLLAEVRELLLAKLLAGEGR